MKKILKVLAAIAALALIALLVLFVDGFAGNPVSRMLAKGAAQRYVQENYADMGLAVESVGYSFKEGAYLAHARSATSVDTAFAVYVDSFGKVMRDDCAYEVKNRMTTWRRLDEELRRIGTERIAPAIDEDWDSLYLSFDKAADGEDGMATLVLDMPLDMHNPPLPLTAHAVLYSPDVSYGKIAQVVKKLEDKLAKEGIPVQTYGVVLIPLIDKPEGEGQSGTWVNALMLDDFPATRLQEENLGQAMQQFQEERTARMDAEGKK